jgi:hypothetical protein
MDTALILATAYDASTLVSTSYQGGDARLGDLLYACIYTIFVCVVNLDPLLSKPFSWRMLLSHDHIERIWEKRRRILPFALFVPPVAPSQRIASPAPIYIHLSISYYYRAMAVSSKEIREKYTPTFAAMVLRTLEEVAETSPIPKLAKAAKLALRITTNSTIEVNRMINGVC